MKHNLEKKVLLKDYKQFLINDLLKFIYLSKKSKELIR